MFDAAKASLNLFEALLEEIDVDSGLNAKNALLLIAQKQKLSLDQVQKVLNQKDNGIDLNIIG